MANIIISPNKYIQGKGELANLKTHVKSLGTKFFVIISGSGLKRVGDRIKSSFGADELHFETFNGECSKKEIDRLLKLMEQNGCDAVIGVGGGKILDTAKAVAYYKKTPVAIVPTIASTDAPCSALSVIYTDEGEFEEYLFLPANPNVVLLDTEVVANAPARLLISGMGDALATYFEARATKASNSATCAGGQVTAAAMALAKLCYDTLIAEGVKAKLALERKVCTGAVEKVIEANTFLSGIGFESGGLAGAHAIHNGFTAIEDCHELYHGEKVAFGTLAQLMLENVPVEEMGEVYDFCMSVGLPVTLAEMGITENVEEKIRVVAEKTCAPGESIFNMPFEVTPEKVYAAIMAADALGCLYTGGDCDCGDEHCCC